MKKKILTLFLSCFLIFNSVGGVFANPLVIAPVTISYNSLMALMGIGVAFGVALPQTDEEYWDYTRSLRNHLNLVDEKYLERLDRIVGEWKTNNNNKPDDEKEPLKVPFIPGLDSLFSKVGNEVSRSYNYVNTLLNPIPVLSSTSSGNLATVPMYKISSDVLAFNFYQNDVSKTIYFRSFDRYLEFSFNNFETSWSVNTSSKVGSVGLYTYKDALNSNTIYPLSFRYEYGGTYRTYVMTSVPLDANVVNKKPISYAPSSPSVDSNGEFDIGYSELPLPNIESLPNYQEGVYPPFEVTPSDSPSDSPGDSPSNSPNYDSITDYIVGLVVPSNDYWTNTWNNLYENFTNSFPMVDMGGFKDLVTNEKKFPNIDIDIMGVTGRVVNGDVINSIVDWLRPIIAGFMMLCLMLFNYRKIYKLIRNTEPFGGVAPGTSDFRTGISEYNKDDVKVVDMVSEYRAWRERGGR